MKKLFSDKKFMKFISALLICCIVAGTIGGYPMVSKAAISTSNFISDKAYYGVTDNADGGVDVTLKDGWNYGRAVTTLEGKYKGTKGIHLEVENISTPYEDGYSFVTYMGVDANSKTSIMNYSKNVIAILISSNGNYKIWRTKSDTTSQSWNPTTADTGYLLACGTLETPPSDNRIAFDIEVVEDATVNQYELSIEGNDIITFQEPDMNYWTASEYFDAGNTRFGLTIWPALTDTDTYSLDPYSNNRDGSDLAGKTTYTIKDLSYVTTISLDQDSLSMSPGDSLSLIATLDAEANSAKTETVTWVSDNENVATVDENGNVTAVAGGTATITAKAAGGGKATCTVTVGVGMVTKSDVTAQGSKNTIALKEVSNGVEVQIAKNDWSGHVTTVHPQSLDRGLLYHITDIKKTDESATGSYSIVMSIGNTTTWTNEGARKSSQWYDQKGYMIFYDEDGSFSILRGQEASNKNLTASGQECIVAETIEPLGDNLSVYVMEVGDDWTVVINDKYVYTIPNANIADMHTSSSKEYWVSIGSYSDFGFSYQDDGTTIKNGVYNLNYVGAEGKNARCGATFTISTIAPTVPTVFSDGMMFQQEKPMNVWGYGIPEQPVTATLYKGEEVVETQTTSVSDNGRWDIVFVGENSNGYEGSYDSYSMELVVGDNEDTKQVLAVEDILIGELWLSGGQSNMELKVAKDIDSETILESANNSYLRFFMEPTYPSDMVGSQPAYPALDIPNAYWGYGNNTVDVSAMSSVAYTFAKTLQEKLEVPVGIINTAVGGTYIEAWLSRDAIVNDKTVAQYMKKSTSPYVDTEPWYYDVGTLAQNAGEMSTLYNAKIGPLEGMNIAGTIWYQGESNEWNSDVYDDELDLLKRSWSTAFGYEEEDMPFIFTQLAPYEVSDVNKMVKGYMALYMEQAWKRSEDKNTAMLTLYDLPLEHMKEDGTSTNPIHPYTKTPVGERFALSALNMVYTGGDEYTAPVYESMETVGNAIYITFEHVGNGGLKTTDSSKDVHGFTIAGADGVFVDAKAIIVDSQTVKVWNDYVTEPLNVIYAFNNMNQGSNLCNSVGIPASPFRTVELNDTVADPNKELSYFIAQDWMYADEEKLWVCTEHSSDSPEKYFNYQPSFAVTNGKYEFDSKIKTEGLASLKVDYTGNFAVSPVLTYHSLTQDWSKFNYLSVDMFNPAADVDVTMVITYGEGETVNVPTVEGNEKVAFSGSSVAFSTVTFDLTKVDEDVLSALTAVTFDVEADKAGTMYFDAFTYGMDNMDYITIGGDEDHTNAVNVYLNDGYKLPIGYYQDKYIIGWSNENVAVDTYDAANKANYVAEYIDLDMLDVAAQQNQNEGKKNVWRFIGSVNNTTDYTAAGFVFSNKNLIPALTDTSNKIVYNNNGEYYTGIKAKFAGERDVTTKSASEIYSTTYSTNLFIKAYKLQSAEDMPTLYVRSYVILQDGTVVYGKVGTLSR